MIGDELIMIEVLDRTTGSKLMAMLFCKILYQEESYVIYCVRRGEDEANLFVSRLIKNSEGYSLDNHFVNGEKEVLEGIVKRLLNKDSILDLEQDGFFISSEISLTEGQFFDIKKCYVTTVSKGLIKECMIFYGLVTKSLFDSPIVEVQDEKGYFNKGFVSNIIVIIFGIVVVIFCLVTVVGILFHK